MQPVPRKREHISATYHVSPGRPSIYSVTVVCSSICCMHAIDEISRVGTTARSHEATLDDRAGRPSTEWLITPKPLA